MFIMASKCLAAAASPTVRDEEAQGGRDLFPSSLHHMHFRGADTSVGLGVEGGTALVSKLRNE